MNKYGLRVSPCIVPLWMCIGLVLSKNYPTYIVVEFVYILPTSFVASIGYPRSSIMASSLAWSMEPNAFLKSM
jgi:hypothetical protein